MKKIIIFLTLLSLMIVLPLGCTNVTTTTSSSAQTTTTATTATSASETTTATETTVPAETYTVQVLVSPESVMQPDTAVAKAIKEKFNIVFETVAYGGDMREKQALLLSSGEYGEIQWMQREDMVLNYINAGALLDLDPYLKSMPNFVERYKDIIPYWRLPGNGTLYKWETNIPRQTEADMEVNDMLVRSDAIERAGWAQPLSTDQWVAFIKEAVKDTKDVDGNPVVGLTLPMAEPWGMAGVVPILYEKSDKYSNVSNEGYTYNLKTQKFEDFFKNSYVKESFQFLNNLYREGLLDEECFTDTNAQTQAKVTMGKTVTVLYCVWTAGEANKAFRDAGHPEMEYVNLPIQTNTSVANHEKREIRAETTRTFDSWALTKNCKYPERLLALIDWATTDEGQILLRSGIEGVHWVRENGKRVVTDNFRRMLTDQAYADAQGIGSFFWLPMFNMYAADGQPHALGIEAKFIEEKGISDRAKEVFAALGWASSKSWYLDNGYFAPTGLAGSVYLDPATDLGRTHSKMTELRVRYSANLIMAATEAEFQAVYDEAMAEYDKLNPQAVIDEFNRLLEEKAVLVEEYKNR